MDTRMIYCGDLKTKVRVSFIVHATSWEPKTKYKLRCGEIHVKKRAGPHRPPNI